MTLLVVVLVLTALSSAASGQQASAPHTLTFHHLHYRVGDPARAMNETARALDGTRALLQGHGVAVQTDEGSAVFDRLEAGGARMRGTAREQYERAAAWLADRGFDVPAVLPAPRLASALATEHLDHIGFATADLPAARARLRGVPLERDDDVAIRVRDGDVAIEITVGDEREDRVWCPMHPDVRAPEAGSTCPLCGMDLVPIPPPRIGEYRMDAAVLPAPDGRGAAGLRLVIRDPDTGDPVRAFATVHERPFHLFIVGRDLEHFAHVHPEAAGEGTFELRDPIPPGEYMLIADFLPHGGTSQTLQRAIVTPGYEGPLMPPAPRLSAGPAARVVHGLRIALETEDLVARKQVTLRFTVRDEATGRPVTDLEPYLGAPAHLLIVNADLTGALHGHPIETGTGGPTVTFEPLIPVAGSYKVWVQVQRGGRVVTAPFVLDVPER